jgi:hypothetical protein
MFPAMNGKSAKVCILTQESPAASRSIVAELGEVRILFSRIWIYISNNIHALAYLVRYLKL